MSVGKNKKYSSERNDPIINFLSLLTQDAYIVSSNKELFEAGSISLKNRRASFPTFENVLNSYSHLQFDSLTHLESKTEGHEINLDSFIKGTINLEYNFLIKQYEDYVVNNDIPDLNLPNFYDTVNQELIKTPDIPFDGVSFFQKELSLKYPPTPVSEEYKKVVYNSSLDDELKRLTKTSSLSQYFKKYNPFKYSFPFYAEAVFDNLPLKQESQSMNELLTKYNLLDNVLNYYSEKRGGKNLILTREERLQFRGGTFQVPVSVNTSTNYVSLSDFFKTAPELKIPSSNNIEFFQKLEEIVDKNKVSYESIISGAPCYYEVIGYKISKYNTRGQNPLQEFYLPNTREQITEFVDTQVKYGSTYRYKISLMAVVIAASYRYTQLSKDSINFELEPQIDLYEIDSIDYQNNLLDSPPLEPEVEVLPYIGFSNKIKFNLNTAVGRKLDTPLPFNADESAAVSRIYAAQNRKDQRILFESEDPSDYFEVFRLEQKPKELFDFNFGEKFLVENNDSSAGSFVDNIQQNKKYYYIFRSVDYHKNISNPSPIYEVELLNENGAIYPNIKIINLNFDQLKTSSKNFRRFLSISPNLGNTLISLEKNNNFQGLKDSKTILEKAVIGVNTPGVWNRKFKIRVSSISTGRKFDINVVFGIKKEE